MYPGNCNTISIDKPADYGLYTVHVKIHVHVHCTCIIVGILAVCLSDYNNYSDTCLYNP